jgi:uncharacterized membrane protein YhaH (DUF805 family)
MNLVKLFFSFRGRVNLAGYWLVSLTWTVLAAVLYYQWTASGVSGVPIGVNHLVDAVLALVVIPPIASCLAVLVKRLHDRNKSAGWLLLFVVGPSVMEMVAPDLDSGPTVVLMFLSIAIWLWGFVELSFVPGTAGPNRYGPDPLGGALLPSTWDETARDRAQRDSSGRFREPF